MRSARSDDDLTTKARIRDAAIDLVARNGPTATTVRAVAAAANVSPGLVLHHFGSKDGLSAACDEFVLQRFHDASEIGLSTADVLNAVAVKDDLSVLAGYAAQALRHGTPFARVFFARVVEDAQRYLDDAVRNGVVRPTDDELARAEFMSMFSLGMLVLSQYLSPGTTAPEDYRTVQARYMVPILELYTHGLFTDDSYLIALRAQQQGDSAGEERS